MARLRGLALVATLICALAAAAEASAARIDVDETRDAFGSKDGSCSLREAVEAVNRASDFGGCRGGGGYGYYDVIVLRSGVHRLALSSQTETTLAADADNSGGDLDLLGGNQVVLVHFGPGRAVIDAAGGDRALQIANNGALVLIQALTIRGGRSGGDGGGVLSNGDVVLLMSALTANRAAGEGGGIAVSGDLADLSVLNATVSGNVAGGRGGGVATVASQSSTVRLSSATVARNRASRGGGVFLAGGDARLENTILALNRGADGRPSDCASGDGAVLSSFGGNIFGSTSGCRALTRRPLDIVDRDPGLLALADNGGPVPSHALAPASSAVDAAKGGLCYRFDARRVPRRFGGRCDIGAYERAVCAGVLVDLVGGSRGDRLSGDRGRNGIIGLGGPDRLAGRRGDDGLCGGAGGDLLRGGRGQDALDGGTGIDRCLGGESLRRCQRR